MKNLLIDYIREESQCNYTDIYDYFKDLGQCNDELKVKYLMDLFMFIYQHEQTEQMVKITESEYERLMNDSEFLSCLRSCGVDNWGGYDDAWDMMNSE